MDASVNGTNSVFVRHAYLAGRSASPPQPARGAQFTSTCGRPTSNRRPYLSEFLYVIPRSATYKHDAIQMGTNLAEREVGDRHIFQHDVELSCTLEKVFTNAG